MNGLRFRLLLVSRRETGLLLPSELGTRLLLESELGAEFFLLNNSWTGLLLVSGLETGLLLASGLGTRCPGRGRIRSGGSYFANFERGVFFLSVKTIDLDGGLTTMIKTEGGGQGETIVSEVDINGVTAKPWQTHDDGVLA